jgi:hypothetical protein
MRSLKLRLYAIVLGTTALFLIGISPCFAVEDDFGPSQKISSKYFTIYYSPQIDPASLTQQLNMRAADEILTGIPLEKANPATLDFATMLDTLFLRVCDILDMHLYSFKGDLKICQNQEQLNHIYYNLFESDLANQKSFYVASLNTIYICAPNFSKEVLGHEIGHAIISSYFVVQPPIKVAEVLAGYVEYQLRKSE